MRIKALLAAATILVAGYATSMAQSNVYSLNVVGYVNRAFTGFQFHMLSNPLNATNNGLSTIMPSPAAGTAIYVWDPTALGGAGDFTTNFTYGGPWDVPNAQFVPGAGMFMFAGGDFTNTFVGEVQQGSLSQAVVGNFGFNIIGSQVPVGGAVTNVMVGFPAVDGDSIYQWDPTALAGQGDFVNNSTYGGGTWSGTITSIGVGDAFLLLRTGPNANWVRNFTVQ